MSALAQDIRYALRSLGRAPGFTLVALITVALGIGGTTAIFSVVDGILLRPLPYPDPSLIVRLSRSTPNGIDASFSPADFIDYKQANRSFSAVAAYREDIVDLTGRGDPVRLTAMETTSAFFDVFGLPPIAGRVYGERSDQPTGPRIAVISETFWRQQLGSAQDVVGSVVRLNGVPTTIVGIMPAAFVHPQKVDLWMLAPRDAPTVPIAIEGDLMQVRGLQYFQVAARMRPGVTLAQTSSDLRTISERLAREHPETNAGDTAIAVPLHEALVGDVRTALMVLFGAVGFVLLIACANVASLLLARGTGRRREFAVRAALGASRWRLTAQLLTESLMLAAAGGAIGLLLSYWGIDALLSLAPESLPRIREVHLDPRVAAFATAASVLVGVLFGLVPAIDGSTPDVTDALKDGGRTGSARSRARNVLVVGEIALSLVLLIGAGLMLTSFARLRAVDPGFTVQDLVLVEVPLPQARYTPEAQAQFYQDLHERLRANAITARSALIFPAPFGGANASAGYQVEGAPARSRTERTVAQLAAISPGYFQAMGIPLLEGRDVAFTDKRDGQSVGVINRTQAEREWPGQNPIGKRVAVGPTEEASSWLTVVGVVADSKRNDLQAGTQPAIYLPFTQFTIPFMGVAVRSEAGSSAVAAEVRQAVRGIDPELPIGDVDTIERVLERVTGQPRFRAFLIGAFAAVALLLAVVGLYGLISYSVAQRVPELGVRIAVGASPAQVLQLILGQGVRLAIAGVAIGLVGALAVARLLQGLLFSISATDPVVYMGLAALLLAIAALACYVPARRALRIDPMTALRAE